MIRIPGVVAALGLLVLAHPLAAQAPTRDDSVRVRLAADFRLREEHTSGVQPARTRLRVRFRGGGTFQLSPELLVGARISTGDPADPRSPHHTLGAAFRRIDLNLDRAHVTFAPRAVPGLQATAGKFGHPFWSNPVYGELVWDADVQPEGAALTYARGTRADTRSLALATGVYALLENASATDVTAFVAQAAGRHRLAARTFGTAAVAWYGYSGLATGAAGPILRLNAGNAIAGDGGFASDFRILNALASLDHAALGRPLVLSGEYIRNFGAAPDQRDSGWAVGTALGALAQPGGWRGYYQWQVVAREAVLSAVAQDDFVFGTSHRSHVFGVAYQWRRTAGVHLWALLSRPAAPVPAVAAEPDRLRGRVRLDLNLTF
ncbi:putative porin [soil metagenome]